MSLQRYRQRRLQMGEDGALGSPGSSAQVHRQGARSARPLGGSVAPHPAFPLQAPAWAGSRWEPR